MDTIAARCRDEVDELHVFFEQWFHGLVDEDDFERFEAVLAEDFELVTPDGASMTRADILEYVRTRRGSAQPDTFRLWVEGLRHRQLGDALHLVSYTELQETPQGGRTKRRSSAILRENPANPHGLDWLLVHETWIGDKA